MRTTVALILVVVALSLTGQVLMKKGVAQIGDVSINALVKSPVSFVQQLVTNPLLILGFLCAGIGAVIWLAVLSRSQFNFAVPLFGGLAYLFVPVVSWLFLGESMTLTRIIGILLISGGVFFVTR